MEPQQTGGEAPAATTSTCSPRDRGEGGADALGRADSSVEQSTAPAAVASSPGRSDSPKAKRSGPERANKRRVGREGAQPDDRVPLEDALQRGLIEIRDTGTVKGLGVFATTALEEQTFVGEYTGEVLTAEEYALRYPKGDAQYVFQVNDDYLIDAGDPDRSPGPVRYTNHR